MPDWLQSFLWLEYSTAHKTSQEFPYFAYAILKLNSTWQLDRKTFPSNPTTPRESAAARPWESAVRHVRLSQSAFSCHRRAKAFHNFGIGAVCPFSGNGAEMQRNTGYFPTESLEPSGNRLFSRSALNEGDLFRGSLNIPVNQYRCLTSEIKLYATLWVLPNNDGSLYGEFQSILCVLIPPFYKWREEDDILF